MSQSDVRLCCLSWSCAGPIAPAYDQFMKPAKNQLNPAKTISLSSKHAYKQYMLFNRVVKTHKEHPPIHF